MTAADVVAFDAYGTLLDVASALRQTDGAAALPADFSDRWRAKQLEYTWTLQAMGAYRDFAAVTADALDHTIAATGAGGGLRDALLDAYRRLAPFPDAPGALRALHTAGVRLAVLSNGTAAMLVPALQHAGIAGLFEDVVSVDEIGIYKPDPRVYRHAAERLGVPLERLELVSANAWDAGGARRCGCRASWVNRRGAPPEYGLGEGARELADLGGLVGALGG